MLTGDENIVDVDFSVLWQVKPDGVGDYLFNIQNPEGTVKAVAESAMREVIGRSEHPADPDRRARRTSKPAVQELMQKTLDHYRRRHSCHAGAAAEGRSAGAGDRRLPRRAGGARRPRARAERGADLRQPRRAGSARPRRADHAGRRSLSRADRRRGQGPDLALPARSTSNTRRRPTSPASACISKPWSACSAAPTRSSSIPARERRRRGALSAAQRTDRRAPQPHASAPQQHTAASATEPHDETQSRSAASSPSLAAGRAHRRLQPLFTVYQTRRRWWCGSASRSA